MLTCQSIASYAKSRYCLPPPEICSWNVQIRLLKALIAVGIIDPLFCCQSAVRGYQDNPPATAAWLCKLWGGAEGDVAAILGEAAFDWEAAVQLRLLPSEIVWGMLLPQILVR